MKMHDMGKKESMGAVDVTPKPTHKSRVYYPSLSLYDKVPGELMKKDIGDMCRIEIVVKVTRKSVNEGGGGKRMDIGMDIHKLGIIGPAGKRTKKEYMKMSQAEKDDYDKESVGL